MTLIQRWSAAGLVILAIAAAASDAVAVEPNQLSPAEIADGWLLLFDGETLFGWQKQTKADWQVNDDGAIAATSGQRGLLTTTSEFADYVLKVEFRASPQTNSGVFLRTSPQPTNPKEDCYELNIADPSISDFPTGSFVDRQKASVISPSDKSWHAYEVTARGNHFQALLDGRPVLDHTTPLPDKGYYQPAIGYIGLQFREGPIEFRNIKLKPLSLKSIFNGRDLTGWRVLPGHASVFSVVPPADKASNKASGKVDEPVAASQDSSAATADKASAKGDIESAGQSGEGPGVLNVKDGNGALESDGKYADFIMQLDVFSNGKGLNSGIFFRSIPGQFWNGYECQINNAMNGAERSLPKDFGTGAIYRRQPARRIVADDFAWFALTFTAAGPHMAAWVNGYPVTDWTDTRKPNNNPRNGLRLDEGTLQIQGHDPTTDLSFRHLQIVELPLR